MSAETEKKQKVALDPKYILKLTLTLLITCVLVAGILGYVNSITAGPIAEYEYQNTVTALKKVVADPSDLAFEEVTITEAMKKAAADSGVTLTTVYALKTGGQDAGCGVKLSASGSQGDIVMMVGIDPDGAVSGVSIISNSETSGIGSKVMDNKPLASGTKVLDQFEGKTAADQPLRVGKNVDAISGATVSSKGVTKGVNGALAIAAAMD